MAGFDSSYDDITNLPSLIGLTNLSNAFLENNHISNLTPLAGMTSLAYLDVGNMVFYGYPQDWIRIVGKRIAKLHIKDFRYRKGQTEWVPLREGDIDWMEVYQALADIGYHGTATVELDGGSELSDAAAEKREHRSQLRSDID